MSSLLRITTIIIIVVLLVLLSIMINMNKRIQIQKAYNSDVGTFVGKIYPG